MRVLRLLGASSAVVMSAQAVAQQAPETMDVDKLPASITVNAVIRDFKGAGLAGGHPDFEAYSGSAARVGLVRDTFGEDGKPVLASTSGQLITTEWKDAAGRAIYPLLFGTAAGDKAGAFAASTPKNITSADSFSSWYNDVPGVNMTANVPLTMVRTPGTNRYVIDSASHAPWKDLGGFFPINGALYGNFSSWEKNFHFTTEIEATFMYDADTENVFKFSGDDDVWVYVDGKLVMDLGGLHPRKEQTLDLSRLAWLVDGKSYTLKVFHAERRTSESNFRMETTLNLLSVNAPTSAALHD